MHSFIPVLDAIIRLWTVVSTSQVFVATRLLAAETGMLTSSKIR